MILLIKRTIDFLGFYLKARTRYGVHSPFVNDFLKEVLDDNRQYYAFVELEPIRDYLLENTTRVEIQDHGAGSAVSSKKTKTIGDIAKHSLSTPYVCKILFKLVKWKKPATILELGTSLGLSSLYMASAAPNAKIITIEGDITVAAMAKKMHKTHPQYTIQVMEGTFKQRLPEALKQLKKLDFAFIDGDHKKESTIDYFKQCLAFGHDKSVFILDDIHWSKPMKEAWMEIQQIPSVTMTIDLYFWGIVFFDTSFKDKTFFKLIARKHKPFEMGFFK